MKRDSNVLAVGLWEELLELCQRQPAAPPQAAGDEVWVLAECWNGMKIGDRVDFLV